MTDFQGQCHCGNTKWTASLEKDQQSHILWYVDVAAISRCSKDSC